MDKKRRNRWFVASVPFWGLITIASCGGGGGSDSPPDSPELPDNTVSKE